MRWSLLLSNAPCSSVPSLWEATHRQLLSWSPALLLSSRPLLTPTPLPLQPGHLSLAPSSCYGYHFLSGVLLP